MLTIPQLKLRRPHSLILFTPTYPATTRIDGKISILNRTHLDSHKDTVLDQPHLPCRLGCPQEKVAIRIAHIVVGHPQYLQMEGSLLGEAQGTAVQFPAVVFRLKA